MWYYWYFKLRFGGCIDLHGDCSQKHMQDPDELLDPTKSPTQPPNTCWTWHTVDRSIATIAAKWQTPEGTQPEPAGTAHLERF